MFRWYLTTVLVLFTAGNVPAQSAKTETRPLTLDECVALALEHNFDVQIERLNPEVSRLSLEAAYAPYEPGLSFSMFEDYGRRAGFLDPTLNIPRPANETTTERFASSVSGQLPFGTTYSSGVDLSRSSGTQFGNNSQYDPRISMNIRQPLLKNAWIDSARRQIQINEHNLNASELVLRDLLMRICTQVEVAYYDLIFSYKSVEVQQKALTLAERLLEDNRKRVQAGAMAPLEEKQAESQVAARKADLLSARQTLSVQQNVLKNLLTDDFMQWHPVSITPADTLIALPQILEEQDSWNKGVTMRPDLLRLKEELEKTNIELRYNKNQIFPQLDLVASYGQNGVDTQFSTALDDAFRGRNRFYSIGAEFRIPLSNKAARHRYESSKISKQQALLQLKQLEQSIIIEIDNAIQQVRTDYERVAATREARLYAEAALEAEEKKLANGASTSFVVLELQRNLTDARSAEIRSLADYNKSLAQLFQSEGSTLDKHNLFLSVE